MPASADVIARTRSRLGRAGAWLGPVAQLPVPDEQRAAARLEELGYGSLFAGEPITGKEIFAHLATLLAATERVVVASGIANIWARVPASMHGGAATLAAAWPGRVLLGVGVSHAPIVERTGQRYERPLAHLRRYLEQMDGAVAGGPETAAGPDGEPVLRIVGALRPKALALAAELTDGAHPYFVPVLHTELARRALGPDKLLVPEQAVLLAADQTEARRLARTHLARYLRLPNYANNLRALGYGESDLAGGGSDRLVDDLVAWGDEAAIATRVEAHLAAGADHVVVQALGEPHDSLEQLERLAPALTGL